MDFVHFAAVAHAASKEVQMVKDAMARMAAVALIAVSKDVVRE